MPAPKIVQFRRGTTAQHDLFAGAEGEVTVDTDKNTLVVHDGSTIGGHPVRLEAAEFVRPRYLTMRAAITQRGVPSLGFSAPENAPTAIAIQEGEIISGAAAFGQNQEQVIQDHFMLPVDWVPPLDLEILWRSSQVTGQVQWQIEVAGVPLGETISNATFNPPQVILAQAGNGVPFQLVTSVIPNLDTTNAAPEGELFFRLKRLSDTLQDDAQLLALRFVVRVKSK